MWVFVRRDVAYAIGVEHHEIGRRALGQLAARQADLLVVGLNSDEYTNPRKRHAMHEKRTHKTDTILPRIESP